MYLTKIRAHQTNKLNTLDTMSLSQEAFMLVPTVLLLISFLGWHYGSCCEIRSSTVQRCTEPYRPPCVPLQVLQPREWRNLERRRWNQIDQTWDPAFLRHDVLFSCNELLVWSAHSNLLQGRTLKMTDIIANSVGVLHGGSPFERSCPISPGDLQPWAFYVRCGLETNNCKNRWVVFWGVCQPGLSCEKFKFRCYSCIRTFRPFIAPKMHPTPLLISRIGWKPVVLRWWNAPGNVCHRSCGVVMAWWGNTGVILDRN